MVSVHSMGSHIVYNWDTLKSCAGYMLNVDLIECTLPMYLNIVLIWPDDGYLQPKHVALKFY